MARVGSESTAGARGRSWLPPASTFRASWLVAAAALACWPLAAQEPTGEWTPEETIEAPQVVEVVVGPRGADVLFAVERAVRQGDEHRWERHLRRP